MTFAPPIPPILTTEDLHILSGWPTWKLKRWLLKTGAGTKRGKLVVTSIEVLKDKFPELAAVIQVRWAESSVPLEDRTPATETWRGSIDLVRKNGASQAARTRTLEADVRRIRSEIRKLRTRLRKASKKDTKNTPCSDV